MFKNYFKKIYKKLKSKYTNEAIKKNEKFISILNHDIKTVLLAQIQSLKLYLQDSAPKEILYEILNSNYFLYEIIKNTIFLSDYETEAKKPMLENVDITGEASNICKCIEKFAHSKNQKIIFKTNSEKIICKADKEMVNKIIYNILTSCISYGFENSNIEVSVRENKNTIYFSAKNKSIYMSHEKIKNILSDKKASDFNQIGMNLNLNIANKLINAHKWDIVANSKKDNTNIFGFIVKK